MSLKLLKQSLDCLAENPDTTEPPSKSKRPLQKEDTIHKKVKTKVTKSKLHENKTEDNVKRLLAMSVNTLKADDAEKIVSNVKKGYKKKKLPKAEMESIFTEEDFRKFEEEYFNS